MIVDATVVEKADRLIVYSPKRVVGTPLHTLSLKYKGILVKLITGIDDLSSCVCDPINCGGNKIPRSFIGGKIIPRNTCIICDCSNVIYVLVPEVLIQ